MLNVAFAIFFLGLRSDFLQKPQMAPSGAPEAPEQDEWTRVPPCHPALYNDKAASQPVSGSRRRELSTRDSATRLLQLLLWLLLFLARVLWAAPAHSC